MAHVSDLDKMCAVVGASVQVKTAGGGSDIEVCCGLSFKMRIALIDALYMYAISRNIVQ